MILIYSIKLYNLHTSIILGLDTSVASVLGMGMLLLRTNGQSRCGFKIFVTHQNLPIAALQ